MKLTTRVLFVLGFTILVLILALYFTAQVFIMSSADLIEEQQSDANIRLIQDQIRSDAEDLGIKARDWAVWDDTCRFMTDQNRNYSDTVITAVITYESLQITGLLFYDTSGNLVASQGYDPDRKIRINVSDSTKAFLSKNIPLLLPTRGGKKKAGIVSLPDGLYLVGMHTILPTSGSGPGHGTLVMLQPVDDKKIAAIGNRYHLPVTISDLNDPVIRNHSIVSQLYNGTTPIVRTRGADGRILAGYTLVPDIDNEPVILLQVDTDRTISEPARTSIMSLFAALLITGVLCMVAMFILLYRYIISPLVSLDASLQRIAYTNMRSERLAEGGDDEIASIKRAMNSIFQELQDKEAAIVENSRKSALRFDSTLDILAGEIRTINRSLKSCTEVIAKDGGKTCESDAGRITAILTSNLAVIRTLGTLTRIYQNRPAMLPVVLSDLLEQETREYPEEKIRWDDDCRVSLMCDEMLMTALHIIITSCLRAGEPASVMISTRENTDGTAEVSVICTGKGLSDEVKARVLEPVPPVAEDHAITGTDLYIAKIIIEYYGGRIWVDDRVPGHPERGSVIRFTLKKA